MTSQLTRWPLVALLAGVLLAGCGGSSNSTSTSQSSPAPAPSNAASGGATTSSAATSATGTSAAGTSSTGTSSTPASAAGSASAAEAGAAHSPVSKVAASICAHGIPATASLSPALKAKIAKICDLAASGHLLASQEAARKACIEAVNSPEVPAGPAKEKALAACRDK